MRVKNGSTHTAAGIIARRHVPHTLGERWEQLHHGDREPWPDEELIGRLASKYSTFEAWVYRAGGSGFVAQGVQSAWQAFHAGDFQKAIEVGARLGPLGATAANKAAAIDALSGKYDAQTSLAMLDAAAKRGEQAVAMLPDYANGHYMVALALGRYSQKISIVKALAQGLATRVHDHLERALELEPRHAEAHVALGVYHAEIVGMLGAFAASLTYGASANTALEHFRKALKLAPRSPIVHIEYAHGLMVLDAERHQREARKLYERAAACQPTDVTEELDVARAKHNLV